MAKSVIALDAQGSFSLTVSPTRGSMSGIYPVSSRQIRVVPDRLPNIPAVEEEKTCVICKTKDVPAVAFLGSPYFSTKRQKNPLNGQNVAGQKSSRPV